jgi:hypothetical protein
MPPRAPALSPTRLFVTVLILVIATNVRADVTASLPLQGYFRAGRFTPVRLQVRGGTSPLTISAEGAISTEYRVEGNTDVIVPWLPLVGSPGALRITGAAGLAENSHGLSDDERLVALASENAEAARTLFPDKRVIAIPLDLSRPLLEPALAWEGIDGVVLSASAAKQLSAQQVEVLASAGVVLAIHASPPPDNHWPWKREGDFWVLRHAPAGPGDVIEASAYAPTYDWLRGWPAAYRRQLLLAALVFILLAVAISLWRSRAMPVTLIAFCSASTWLVAWWYSRQSPVLELAGGVLITDGRLSQVDVWHWRSTLHPAEGNFPAEGLTYPILPDTTHAALTGLRLVCGSNGGPTAFEYHLEPQQSLAFLTRVLRTDVPPPVLSPAAEPFKNFADELYLGRGESIRGQFGVTDPHTGLSMPLVVIRRGDDR